MVGKGKSRRRLALMVALALSAGGHIYPVEEAFCGRARRRMRRM